MKGKTMRKIKLTHFATRIAYLEIPFLKKQS